MVGRHGHRAGLGAGAPRTVQAEGPTPTPIRTDPGQIAGAVVHVAPDERGGPELQVAAVVVGEIRVAPTTYSDPSRPTAASSWLTPEPEGLVMACRYTLAAWATGGPARPRAHQQDEPEGACRSRRQPMPSPPGGMSAEESRRGLESPPWDIRERMVGVGIERDAKIGLTGC